MVRKGAVVENCRCTAERALEMVVEEEERV
jgi:hypothetical protein